MIVIFLVKNKQHYIRYVIHFTLHYIYYSYTSTLPCIITFYCKFIALHSLEVSLLTKH